MSGPEDDAVEVPIIGTLDLHTFRLSELGSLLPEYLRACRERGLYRVRVVHGKGTGAARASVHAILQRLPEVESFTLADGSSGGWGATWVSLRREGASGNGVPVHLAVPDPDQPPA